MVMTALTAAFVVGVVALGDLAVLGYFYARPHQPNRK
jgi:hypothetical protein